MYIYVCMYVGTYAQLLPRSSLPPQAAAESSSGAERSAGMAAVVLVFDFDKTIIDCDSDHWVITELGVAEAFEQLRPGMPWNALMDRMMGELHSRGRSVEDIADCLRTAPLDSHVANAIKTARALGCELRVVSDANQFFIRTILEHHGLLEDFSEIDTNPSFVDEEGRLRISPYHDFNACPHGCRLCPSNMCKGMILDGIRASSFAEGKKQVIYLGDGQGDFCPSCRLCEGDHVMPRKNYPLWNLIHSNSQLLKAEVHEWSTGEDLERVLLQLIHRSISVDANRAGAATSHSLSVVDCKHETIPAAEAVSLPLRVPH